MMIEGHFKGDYSVFQGYLKKNSNGISMKFQMCFKEVSIRVFQERFRVLQGLLKGFQESVKGDSRKMEGYLKEV